MVQALGLTFHELATNSLKYGAAGAADGEVYVLWRVVDEGRGGQRLELEWREVRTLTQYNGTKRGFGTRLVDINISELGGVIDRIATASGLAIRISSLCRPLRECRCLQLVFYRPWNKPA